ncbi:MAG: hypothetical protein IT371_04650 [Deltaproteobacteria bacterium]|nr:hypothetical protein [Deltaproteobacteria bacterium]
MRQSHHQLSSERRVFAGCLPVLALLAAAGCSPSNGSGPPAAGNAFAGSLTPAAGLAAADYEIYGSQDGEPVLVDEGGGFRVGVAESRTTFVFATPKEGSGTAAKLAKESGIYFAPSFGKKRIVRAGAGYAIAEEGPAALDSTTTMIALLLMHPAVGHPAAEVTQAQVEWMLDRLRSGWACLSSGASSYDGALAAGRDPTMAPELARYLGDCLATLAALPETKPVAPPAPAGRALTQVPYELKSKGKVVSLLKLQAATETSITVRPETSLGTAMDYYYTARQVDPSLVTKGLQSPIFENPDMLVVNPTVAEVGVGVFGGRPYLGFLDFGTVIGKYIEQLSAGAGLKPKSAVTLEAGKLYEIRFFSGGIFSGGVPDFVNGNFKEEARIAFVQNVTTAVLEALSLFPATEGLLGEASVRKVVIAGVYQLVAGIETILVQKGPGGITAEDLYELFFNVAKSIAEKITEEAAAAVAGQYLEPGYKAFAKRALRGIKFGAKTLFKTVVALPGKAGKGCALLNRAYRMVTPDSIMEYHLAAVNLGGTAPPPPPPPSKCTGGSLSHPFTVGPFQGMKVTFTLSGVELCKQTPGDGSLELKGRVCAEEVTVTGELSATEDSYEFGGAYLKTSTASNSVPADAVSNHTPLPISLKLKPGNFDTGTLQLEIKGQKWYTGLQYHYLTVTGSFLGPNQQASSSFCN